MICKKDKCQHHSYTALRNCSSYGSHKIYFFCAYHQDHYPKENKKPGPDISLEERKNGNNFAIKDCLSMYQGNTIPGFPVHPHRGFEAITFVLKGVVDHAMEMKKYTANKY